MNVEFSRYWLSPPIMILLACLFLTASAGERNPNPQAKQALTEGQKKAIKEAEGLGADTIVTYNKDGEVKSKERISETILPKNLAEYAKKKSCEDPRPISPRCVVCTDGIIICANISKWASAH